MIAIFDLDYYTLLVKKKTKTLIQTNYSNACMKLVLESSKLSIRLIKTTQVGLVIRPIQSQMSVKSIFVYGLKRNEIELPNMETAR